MSMSGIYDIGDTTHFKLRRQGNFDRFLDHMRQFLPFVASKGVHYRSNSLLEAEGGKVLGILSCTFP